VGELASIKRRVLRQAVRENVDVIEGRYRSRESGDNPPSRGVARIFLFVLVPIVLLSSALFINGVVRGRPNPQEVQAVVLDAPGPISGPSGDFSPIPEPEPFVPTEAQMAALSMSAPIDASVFPLAVRKVIIDPGHGGENRGTEAPGGLIEKEIAFDISTRLRDLLIEASFDVEMTREGDEFISLEERAEFANSREGDLFVSVHLNWIEAREIRGVETFYLGPTEDPYLTELAAKENRDSGYSLADFRRMLDRVYADVREEESNRLATAVQESLFESLSRVNPNLRNRGVKKAPFIVLIGTEMPAILAEVSCLSNEKEARLLVTPEYRQFIAEALFEGIDGYARDLNGTNHMGS
jgi:N-acetylmuramoyl-L-alanine amidase